MRIISPASIEIEDPDEIEAFRDVCIVAAHYANRHGIPAFSEDRRHRAMEFAKRVAELRIHFREEEEM